MRETRPMSIPPDPVTGLCIFPRFRTISVTSPVRTCGSFCAALQSWRKLAASMLRCSTSMRSSSSPSASPGSSASACCGNTPLGRTTRRSPYGSGILVPARTARRHGRTGRLLWDRRRGRPRTESRPGHLRLRLVALEKRLEKLDGQGEDGGRRLLGADLDERLQVPELQRRRMRFDDVGGHAELLRGLVLALGRDDLGAPLALGLRLARHRPLHLGREVDRLHLDGADLDAPGLGMEVEDLLQLLVDLLPLGEEIVELQLPEGGSERRLGELGGRVEEILHLDDGALRVDDPEVDHRAHLQADVVAGDDVLRRHVPGHGAEVDLHHAVDAGDDPVEARALRLREATEPEDDAGLILLDHPQAGDEPDSDRDEEEQQRVHAEVTSCSDVSRGATSITSPRKTTTRTLVPTASGAPATAVHSSPCTSTVPGVSPMASRTSPISPTMPGPPERSGCPALLVSFHTSVPVMIPSAAPTGMTTCQPSPKSGSAQKPRPTCPTRSNEPMTMVTSPAPMNQPCPPRNISAARSATPAATSARAPAFTGSIWNDMAAMSRQMAPTTPGTMVPGWYISRRTPITPSMAMR